MFQRIQQGTVSVVSGSEPINAANCADLAHVLDECVSSGQPRIVLNMQQSPLLDSHGLELLLDYGRSCAERGGTMRIAGPNALCRDILRITGVGERFDLFDEVSDAVRSFAQ